MEIIEKFIEENNLGEISHEEIYNNHFDSFENFCSAEGIDLAYDSLNDEFIEKDNSICYLYMGNTLYTQKDNCDELIIFNDEFYHEDSLEHYGIIFSEFDECYTNKKDCEYGVIGMHGNEGWFLDSNNYIEVDNIYYVNSDIAEENGLSYCGEHDEYYHIDNSCDECDNDSEHGEYLFEYHSDYRKSLTKDETHFRIGFEVEKEDKEIKELDGAYELFQQTGWAKEHDGSLDGESGFELVSPTFDLFDENIIDSFNKVTPYLNASFSSACGGHINYSIAELSPEQTFKTIEGYIPLLYAMYQNRLSNTYCLAKKAELMYNEGDKYQAIALKDNRIEFRIFPAVKSQKHLEWRLGLMKIFANHPRTNVHEVLRDLCSTGSDLHKHLLKIFSLEDLQNKINLFIKYTLEIEEINLKNMINEAFIYNENETPILPPPTHIFKIGDAVTIKMNPTLTINGEDTNNCIGIIEETYDNEVRILFASNVYRGSYGAFGSRWAKVYKKTQINYLPQFGNLIELTKLNYTDYKRNKAVAANRLDETLKVGDIVEIMFTTSSPHTSDVEVGQRVRILEINNGMSISVNNLDDSNFRNGSIRYYLDPIQVRRVNEIYGITREMIEEIVRTWELPSTPIF